MSREELWFRRAWLPVRNWARSSTALAVSTLPAPDHGTSILADVLGRNEYDALRLVPDSPTAKAAADLIAAGVATGPIDQSGITGGRKDWYAVNVDVYGVAAGGRVIVAQERHTWQTKYGRRHKKWYWLLWRPKPGWLSWRELSPQVVRGTIRCDDDPAAPVRRFVDLLPEDLAEAVRVNPRAEWAERTPAFEGLSGDHYYKAVAVVQHEDGGVTLHSIYDHSVEYQIGVTLSQPVRRQHGGGYYVRRTSETAATASVPDNSDLADAPRAVLRVRCEGPYTKYDNGKLAFSRITPLEIVTWPAGIPHPDRVAEEGTA